MKAFFLIIAEVIENSSSNITKLIISFFAKGYLCCKCLLDIKWIGTTKVHPFLNCHA